MSGTSEPARGGPTVDRDSAPFWAALERETVMAQRCAACGTYRCPPLPSCHACGARPFTWERLDGTATVYSAIVVRRPIGNLTPVEVPVVFATVDFEHGCRLVARVLGTECTEIGTAVQADFVHHDGWTELAVRPKARS